ncbi:MAG: hypothetical protein M1834_001956 [Cirrosporium novae-zelandiae]|nr:MAG: hypothetical protein M1834_001956 [Cirrosporium novae-zelandiae]
MADSTCDHTDTPATPNQNQNHNLSTTTITITLTHHGIKHTFNLPATSTLADLSPLISTHLSVPAQNQKLLITPKPGLLKPPFPQTPLHTFISSDPQQQQQQKQKQKITVLGSTASEITALNTTSAETKARSARRSAALQKAKATTTSSHKSKPSPTTPYTFHTLLPLPHLPDPSKSLSLLSRLRSDPGITSTMRTHKFSVSLLTEMDPAAHTTHTSKTLGLNRNKGEVIELRLRTDAYDGYRDYKSIRRTLCHELAHNVWGEHGKEFWGLCRQIEKEVERGDWWGGRGRAVSSEEFYDGGDGEGGEEEEEGAVDEGGWTGGEFVLGSSSSSNSAESSSNSGLSRREILARAAEERIRKLRGGKEEKEKEKEKEKEEEGGGLEEKE